MASLHERETRTNTQARVDISNHDERRECTKTSPWRLRQGSKGYLERDSIDGKSKYVSSRLETKSGWNILAPTRREYSIALINPRGRRFLCPALLNPATHPRSMGRAAVQALQSVILLPGVPIGQGPLQDVQVAMLDSLPERRGIPRAVVASQEAQRIQLSPRCTRGESNGRQGQSAID